MATKRKATRRKWAGYMVVTNKWGHMYYGKGDLKGFDRVLYTGATVGTIFPTREAARVAIRQTLKYAKRRGYKEWSGYRVVPMMKANQTYESY
jgi:hypothetical protein